MSAMVSGMNTRKLVHTQRVTVDLRKGYFALRLKSVCAWTLDRVRVAYCKLETEEDHACNPKWTEYFQSV